MQNLEHADGEPSAGQPKNEKHLKIFKKLCGLTNTQDFKDAELAFYRKSVKFFMADLDQASEEAQQNQQKQHEELLTVKAAIDALLRESCAIDDSELIEFYLCFPELDFIRKTEAYVKEDLLTIELIQKWLEFQKFQTFMFEFAQMKPDDQDVTYRLVQTPAQTAKSTSKMLLETQNVTDIDISFENFKKLMGAGIEAKFGEGLDPSAGWTERAIHPEWSDGMRINIHSRKMPGASMELVRVEEAFKGITCKDLQDYLTTPKHALKMNPSFKENYIIDEKRFDQQKDAQSADEVGEVTQAKGVSLVQERYWRLTLPLMSDRDTTFRIQVKHLDEYVYGPGAFYVLGATFSHEKFPEKQGVVRYYQYICGLCWQSEDKGEPVVNYVEISQIDLGGYFPSTIMNLVLGTLMHSEHRKMYDYMAQRRLRHDKGEASSDET